VLIVTFIFLLGFFLLFLPSALSWVYIFLLEKKSVFFGSRKKRFPKKTLFFWESFFFGVSYLLIYFFRAEIQEGRDPRRKKK